MATTCGVIDVPCICRIEISNRRTNQPEGMVFTMNQDIIEDYTSSDASPALAFIGYLKAITTGDSRAISDFESMFGKDYMGMGAVIVVITLLGKYAPNPELYLSLYENEFYRHPVRPRNRAARVFINDVLDTYMNAHRVSVLDTEDFEGFPDLAEEDNGTVLAMLSPELHHAKFKRIVYVQGIGYAVANLVAFIAYAAEVTVQSILDDIHVAYLENDNS